MLSRNSEICYKSTLYGFKDEKTVIVKYKSVDMQTHKCLKVTPVSLLFKKQKSWFGVKQKSWFGVSPDSFLPCMCCGNKVLEVKCQYCAQTKGFEVASSSALLKAVRVICDCLCQNHP